MSRNTTTEFDQAMAASTVRPFALIELLLDSGPLRYTTAKTLDWNGHTWIGAGKALGLSSVAESAQIVAHGMSVTLSGQKPEDLTPMFNEPVQGRPMSIWLALYNENWVLVQSPYLLGEYRADRPVVSMDRKSISISVSAETEMIDLERARERMWTDEDQQAEYPGDRFFEYVASIQERELTWGLGLQ